MSLGRLVGGTAVAGAVLLPVILGVSVGTIALGAVVGAVAAAGQYAIWRDSWAPSRDGVSGTASLADEVAATRLLGLGALASALLVIAVLGVVWLTNDHRVSPLALFLLAPPAYLAGVYAWRRYGESQRGRGRH